MLPPGSVTFAETETPLLPLHATASRKMLGEKYYVLTNQYFFRKSWIFFVVF